MNEQIKCSVRRQNLLSKGLQEVEHWLLPTQRQEAGSREQNVTN
jgi:hypothetical protein